MKSSVTIFLTDLSDGELRGLLQALQGTAPNLKVEIDTAEKCAGEDAPAASDAPDAPASTTQTPPAAAAEPPKKPRGRPRKDEAAKPADTAAAQPAQQDAPAADTPKATENAVKQAIQVGIKAKGIEKVRAVVSGFQSAHGTPAAKISDLQEKDYGAVVAALNALVEA